ncbi:MAG: YdcF family protein [Clostridiales bacterium]|mgnify:CR=1 FL=1|nr:YdcF family protein [Clostridiales bacterium]
MGAKNQQAESLNQEMAAGNRKSLGRLVRLAILLLCMGVVSFAGLVGYVCYQEVHVPPPSDYDSMIVLGAQVLPSGEPSVQLRWRLDKALVMYGRHPCPIVTCGARGGNEPDAEGKVMRELLIKDGLPPDQIIAETGSEDTRDNIRNAWSILSKLGRERPLIVTSDYHLPRALAIAADLDVPTQGIGSLCRNGLEYWAKNHFREALAWVKYWGIKHLGLRL